MAADSVFRRLTASLLGVALTTGSALAGADDADAVLLPTVTRGAPGEPLRKPGPVDGRDEMRWARELDTILAGAAQDLGLTLDVSERHDAEGKALAEPALVELAANRWIFSPRVEVDDDEVEIRIVAVAPGSKVALSRTESVGADDVEVTALRMMRDVVLAGRHEAPVEVVASAPPPDQPSALVYHARSQGRAVLALNSAALGGYIGFSVQRASGSDDPRLLYPLIALGTGIGLGSSMIIADEWDVGLGDAWFLSAGAWWPTAAGLLLADGYDADDSDAPVYGVAGAAAGLTLSTFALTFKGMSEGGAVLAHSGGAFGLILGGLTELAVEGNADFTPSRGMGFGAGAGVVAAGFVATQVKVSPSRVLLIDLGATLGGMTGAAAASPLVIDDEEDETKVRIWLASTAAGTIAGATIGFFATTPSRSATGKPPGRWALPYGGVIGESIDADGRRALAYGAGVRGAW